MSRQRGCLPPSVVSERGWTVVVDASGGVKSGAWMVKDWLTAGSLVRQHRVPDGEDRETLEPITKSRSYVSWYTIRRRRDPGPTEIKRPGRRIFHL